MKKLAYLTIDDSPSSQTEKLVDYLSSKNIPAILFVRGHLMEKNPKAIEYAMHKGLVIGNHSYAHKPAGEMEPQEWADDLGLCEHLIEAAYRRCNKERRAKYYRFPYIDRGDGVKREQIDKEQIIENEQTKILQNYLKIEGFKQPFKSMPSDYPGRVKDCLYTYTARDWMLNNKHRGKHAIKTRQDLIHRAMNDENLNNKDKRDVILLHDQDGMVDDAIALIDYMIEALDFEFQSL